MGYQQGQGCVVGRRAAWPFLVGGQLFDLAGGGVGVGAGPAFPGHAERVAAGVGGQSAVDAPGKVEDFLRVQGAQQAVTHDLHRRTRQCPLLYCQAFLPGCERGSAQRDPGLGDVVAGARLGCWSASDRWRDSRVFSCLTVARVHTRTPTSSSMASMTSNIAATISGS